MVIFACKCKETVSQIDVKDICCEELGIKLNISQKPFALVYKKTIAHLEDLRDASIRVSDLKDQVNEQEWRDHHITYRNTHSVVLVLVIMNILAHLLFKLYTCIRPWMPTNPCRKETPIDGSPEVDVKIKPQHSKW